MINLMDKILVRTIKIERGKPVLLNKVDFVMFPARSMAKIVQKIGEDFGDEYLYQLGYDAGTIVSDEFIEKLNWVTATFAKKMSSMLRMFEIMGFGKMQIKVWNASEDKVLINLTNHPVINYGVKLFGKKEKICTFYRGIFSAHTYKEFGIEKCHFIETQCISKGAPFCEWSYNYFKDKKEIKGK